jgi:hypothetical protein
VSAAEHVISIWAGSVPSSNDASACRKCAAVEGHLARYIKASGAVGIRWQCSSCGDFGTYGDIRHTFLAQFGAALEDLPVCVDGRSDTPCVICGEMGTEWHHWAPSSIFAATVPAWSDVGAYLCVTHHREWHDVMRAHGLRYPHEMAAVAS